MQTSETSILYLLPFVLYVCCLLYKIYSAILWAFRIEHVSTLKFATQIKQSKFAGKVAG